MDDLDDLENNLPSFSQLGAFKLNTVYGIVFFDTLGFCVLCIPKLTGQFMKRSRIRSIGSNLQFATRTLKCLCRPSMIDLWVRMVTRAGCYYLYLFRLAGAVLRVDAVFDIILASESFRYSSRPRPDSALQPYFMQVLHSFMHHSYVHT